MRGPLAALALLLPALGAAAAPRVEARLDRDVIPLGEAVTLTVDVESSDPAARVELDEGRLPFDVVARGRSRTSSVSLGGGAGARLRQVTAFTFRLAPRRAGELVVPPARATADGGSARTAPLRVRVLPRGAREEPAPGRAWRGWERDLALVVEVDRRTPYAGEGVTASVWLLSPVPVTAYDGYRPPAYDAFWVEELEAPERLEPRVRDVRGVPTRAYLVQRLALHPARAGDVALGPYALAVAVRLGDAGPLGLPDVRRVHRESAPVTLSVKPLPPGAPPGFDPASVGRFTIAAAAEAEATAGQPLAVRLTVEGEGNLRALTLPRLPDVAGARRLEDAASDRVAPRGGRLAGARTVETTFVPDAAGALVVPSVAWTFFDPRAGRYETVRTRELRIPVRAPTPTPTPTSTPTPTPTPTPTATSTATWTSTPPLLALLALLSLAGLAPLVRARRGPAAAPRAAEALRSARRRLESARTLPAPRAAAEIERALVDVASALLGRPARGLDREGLSAALRAAGATPDAAARAAAALDACDAARFGGARADAGALADAALDAVAALDAIRAAAGR